VSLVAALQSDGSEAPVMLVDLSPAGARLKVSDPPQPDAEFMLHFTVHRTRYETRFRVVHWSETDGSFHWGGMLLDLTDEQRTNLRRAVEAAAGMATTWFREWTAVSEEALRSPIEQVLVGTTPAGQEIRLLGEDCTEMGAEGVELFVSTVAGLEGT